MAWKTKLSIAVATLLLASWWGYSSERNVMDAAGSPPKSLRSVVRHILAPKSRSAAIERLNGLRHGGGLSGLTAGESAECWQIIRAFTVEDVQAYLADLSSVPRNESNDVLTGMLFFRWAQIDGVAAAEASQQPPYKENRNLMYSAISAFVDRDLDGAMRWAAASGSDQVKWVVATPAGRLLALQDPEHALERAAAGCPMAVGTVLQTLFGKMSGTEESRSEFFALTAGKVSPQELSQCLARVSSARAEKDPQEALALLDEFGRAGLPAEQVESIRKNVLRYSAYRNPEENLAMMLGPETGVPRDRQLDVYRSWAANEPEKAIAWATQNDKSDFIADAVKKQSFQLLRSGWQPGVDDSNPWVNGFRSQFKAWRETQPESADAWLQTMPGDVRADLSKITHEASR